MLNTIVLCIILLCLIFLHMFVYRNLYDIVTKIIFTTVVVAVAVFSLLKLGGV